MGSVVSSLLLMPFLLTTRLFLRQVNGDVFPLIFCDSVGWVVYAGNPSTLNPQLSAPNPQAQAPNPLPKTLNPNPLTRVHSRHLPLRIGLPASDPLDVLPPQRIHAGGERCATPQN